MYRLDYALDDKFRGITEKFSDEFKEYLIDYHNLNITKERSNTINIVVKCWLVNSYHPVLKGRSKIHLSLDKNTFSKGQIVNGRTSSKKVSYLYTKRFLAFLNHNSYIDLVVGGELSKWAFLDGKWRPTEFSQSYAVVEDKLIDVYQGYNIKAKQKPLKNVILLRDEDGKELPFKMNSHKKEVRGYLQDYNESSLEHTITLDDIGYDVQSYKVYNKDLQKGGRTYMTGGSIQSLSRKDRGRLIVDGKSVVILDFKGFEPSCAYQMKSLVKPFEDPYQITIDGIDPEILRDVCKKALLIMFNTESRLQAEKALTSALRKTYDAEGLFQSGKLFCPVFPIKVILDKLEDEHYQLQDLFYCNFGYELQYAGGLINDYICNYFLQNTNHLIIQTHDEFIGTYNIENEIRKVMQQGFEIILGGAENCHITKEK
ncbi:hypothetical protein [Vibrio phage S4-7]|nr:hypothetical protein [Vibrio phage S4-7]